eukprot:CAMPEP_0177622800 /NCGR_PEP_ID=MMETSP0419_2-20121207/28529_1 /TAXON_ID=582737 /ORGANISM="Tetraselmis sp., Strain GSL018" /LENGTH=81 /DNA_ID=CAMNT_0019123243 /DNA_START=59 /DNA_END=301 /DNA_ORIENTATION=-
MPAIRSQGCAGKGERPWMRGSTALQGGRFRDSPPSPGLTAQERGPRGRGVPAACAVLHPLPPPWPDPNQLPFPTGDQDGSE